MAKRDLGLGICLSPDGEVQIGERVPLVGDWLFFCDPRYPLTHGAAEDMQKRLCLRRDKDMKWIYKRVVSFHIAKQRMDQGQLRLTFERDWKDALAVMVKDYWREGRWRFPAEVDAVTVQEPNGMKKAAFRCRQGHNHEMMSEAAICNLNT